MVGCYRGNSENWIKFTTKVESEYIFDNLSRSRSARSLSIWSIHFLLLFHKILHKYFLRFVRLLTVTRKPKLIKQFFNSLKPPSSGWTSERDFKAKCSINLNRDIKNQPFMSTISSRLQIFYAAARLFALLWLHWSIARALSPCMSLTRSSSGRVYGCGWDKTVNRSQTCINIASSAYLHRRTYSR